MQLPEKLEGMSIHLIGAKGTGMCALAELLVSAGAVVTGSDVDEVFYTDSILAGLGVDVRSFKKDSLDGDTVFVVRSAAYDGTNPVVAEALNRGLPMLTYPEALGDLSARYDASAVAGVHGKTTTTALAGIVLRALGSPATVVVGSAVAGFGNRSTWTGGDRFMVAETCEYRRHFLHYHPRRIILTSVEPDHQDFYPDYESIRAAFLEFLDKLPDGGELIYCSDDSGALEIATIFAGKRPDIRLYPYGESAGGAWKIIPGEPAAGKNSFHIGAFDREFQLAVPGRHVVMDAVAAMALSYLLKREESEYFDVDAAAEDLAGFRGSRRRSEIVGETAGIMVMDDYAHHPTAISTTLKGLKAFYPDRRLIVDFMPHTYSRTAALLNEFADSFGDADILILHPIYASAREKYDGSVTGRILWEKAASRRPGYPTLYCETLDEAAGELSGILQTGDLFITLGAGNNWPLGQRILKEISR
ncbi:MAG: UDP-N-acetylmuramate--L-alanine ligase [Spirochaetaceae bacterium]|nr:UDP-N-acetylmuramate--L-alanine ligase [Spirochaetaceae bacterium]